MKYNITIGEDFYRSSGYTVEAPDEEEAMAIAYEMWREGVTPKWEGDLQQTGDMDIVSVEEDTNV